LHALRCKANATSAVGGKCNALLTTQIPLAAGALHVLDMRRWWQLYHVVDNPNFRMSQEDDVVTKGTIRHKNPLLCDHSSIARMLYVRFALGQKQLPPADEVEAWCVISSNSAPICDESHACVNRQGIAMMSVGRPPSTAATSLRCMSLYVPGGTVHCDRLS
jgi:hypothetical protein